jgi:nitroreductase
MELWQTIYARRAVREFTAAPVERVTLERLIDAAVQAPSAVNEQPWSFTVVQDRSVLARISSESKAHVLRNPPRKTTSYRFEGMLRDPQFDIFYRAPALIVISSVTANEWAVENCALAAENLMLAACAEGLGSCWIGFAQAWLGTEAGKAVLGLPAAYLPVAPLIVGHPRAMPAPVARKPADIRWIGG